MVDDDLRPFSGRVCVSQAVLMSVLCPCVTTSAAPAPPSYRPPRQPMQAPAQATGPCYWAASFCSNQRFKPYFLWRGQRPNLQDERDPGASPWRPPALIDGPDSGQGSTKCNKRAMQCIVSTKYGCHPPPPSLSTLCAPGLCVVPGALVKTRSTRVDVFLSARHSFSFVWDTVNKINSRAEPSRVAGRCLRSVCWLLLWRRGPLIL